MKKVSFSEANFSLEMRTLSLNKHRNTVRMGVAALKMDMGSL